MAAKAERPPFDLENLARKGPPAQDASPEDKGDYVAARVAIQDEHYRGLYRHWSKALLFLAGRHWLRYNEQLAIYEPDTDVPAWRQQPVTNLTYAIFRTAVAKLTKQRPTMEVVPPSGDSEDRESAELANAILEFLWRHLKSPQKVVRALGWFVTTGNVFFDVGWDETAGKAKPRTALVEVPNPDHDPADPTSHATMDVPCACDEEGEPMRRKSTGPEDLALDGGEPYDLEMEPEADPEGEVSLDVDDPFAVRFNPDATSAEDASEWYITKLWSKAKVMSTFGVPAELLGGDAGGDSSALREEFDDMLSRANAAAPDPFLSIAATTGTGQEDAIGDRIAVTYYYAQPDAEAGFPDGRHFIVAGRTKVWPPEDDPAYPNGEAPLPHKFWPPRVPMVSTPLPGQPQGLGMLTQVVPLNEQLNYLDGKIAEYHVTMAMGGIWFVDPADRGIQITSEPGQVKVSKAMGAGRLPPHQAKMNPLPEAVYREREVLQNKLRMVAGVSEIDLGQRPEGVSAGRAFLVLQEASDAAIMPDLMAFEQALEEIGRRQIAIVQERYTEERTIQIRGQQGQWEFRSFKGADLRDGLDVRVQVGSSFPWSKSAQWDTKLGIIERMPQLVLQPDGTIDRQQLAKYLDAGSMGLSAFTSEQDPDLVEIEREHAMFEAYNPDQGRLELPQLGFWQTQPTHLKYHYEFLKRDHGRFQRWHPAAQEAFIAHCELTARAVQGIVNTMIPGANPSAASGGDGAPAPGGEGEPIATGEAPPPAAPPGGAPLRLTRGDRAAAGAA